MADIKALKEKLNSLITDKSTDEEITTIGEIVKEIDSSEEEKVQLANKYDELRAKYIKNIQEGNFEQGKDINPTPAQPKSLEESLNDIYSSLS